MPGDVIQEAYVWSWLTQRALQTPKLVVPYSQVSQVTQATMFSDNDSLAKIFGVNAPMGMTGTPLASASAELAALFGFRAYTAQTFGVDIAHCAPLDDAGLVGAEVAEDPAVEVKSFLVPHPGSIAVPRVTTVERIPGATPGCYGLVLGEHYYHHELEGVSASALKQMLRSPGHYQAWRNGGNADTAARRFGRALHCYLLERPTFDYRYVVWEEGDRRGNDFKDFALQHPGKTILTVEEFKRVKGCAESLLSAPDFPLRGFLEGALDDHGNVVVPSARTEFVIVWVDEETGLTCKMRADALQEQPGSFIGYDAKTTGDAREDAFTYEIGRMNYDLQAAFYMEGMRRFTGKDGVFVFGAVEAQPAHGARHHVIGPNDSYYHNGVRKYRYGLNLYAKCLRENRWPLYEHTKPASVTMPMSMAFYPPVQAL